MLSEQLGFDISFGVEIFRLPCANLVGDMVAVLEVGVDMGNVLVLVHVHTDAILLDGLFGQAPLGDSAERLEEGGDILV